MVLQFADDLYVVLDECLYIVSVTTSDLVMTQSENTLLM